MESIRFPLISEYMKSYQSAKKDADLDLTTVESNTLPGQQARKNVAVQDVRELAAAIRSLVDQDGAAVILTGPPENQEAFAALAEDEEDFVPVKAGALYEDVAKAIEPYLAPGRVFVMETGRALQAALTQVATKLNVFSYVMPFVHERFGNPVPDFEAMVNLVRDLVRAGNGDEFNAVYITHKAFEHVINTEYEANAVAVVVSGASAPEAEGLAAALFGGHTVSVAVTDPPESNDIVLVARKLKTFYQRAQTVQTAMNADKARAAKAQKRASTDASNTVSDETSKHETE